MTHALIALLFATVSSGAPTGAECYAHGATLDFSQTNRGFHVAVRGPQNRLAMLAADAARNLTTFDPATVDPADREDRIDVYVTPDDPDVVAGSGVHVAPLATNVVLRRKGAPTGTQPLALKTVPFAWGNALGGQMAGQGLIATMPKEALVDGVEVVVVSDAAPRSCTLKKDQIARIR